MISLAVTILLWMLVGVLIYWVLMALAFMVLGLGIALANLFAWITGCARAR